jgi:hypothetical protein
LLSSNPASAHDPAAAGHGWHRHLTSAIMCAPFALLIRRMLAYAGRRGLKEVFGDVLAENKRMLDIARHLDFSAERLSEHLDVIRVTRRIGAA